MVNKYLSNKVFCLKLAFLFIIFWAGLSGIVGALSVNKYDGVGIIVFFSGVFTFPLVIILLPWLFKSSKEYNV